MTEQKTDKTKSEELSKHENQEQKLKQIGELSKQIEDKNLSGTANRKDGKSPKDEMVASYVLDCFKCGDHYEKDIELIRYEDFVKYKRNLLCMKCNKSCADEPDIIDVIPIMEFEAEQYSRRRNTYQEREDSSRNDKSKSNKVSKPAENKSVDDTLEDHGDENENSTSDVNKLFNPHVPDWQLDERIKKELAGFDVYIGNYEPVVFFIAHTGLNQIVRGKIGKEIIVVTDDDGNIEYDENDKPFRKQVPKLRLSSPIINAIPTSVTKYDNGLNLEARYKIKFMTVMGKSVETQVNTVEGIVTELRDRNLAPKHINGEEALAGILTSMELRGKVEVTHNIETPGFYTVNDKIECYGLEFKTPSDIDLLECCKFMNDLVEKYRKKDKETGNIIKDRRILPAITIKWAIPAAFDYAMKKLHNKFVPWLQLCGYPSTAKNTVARFALAVWRIHDKSRYMIGFAGTNTEARLGGHISMTTLPVVINEVTKLNDPRNDGLVNMIKNAVDDVNARAKYDRKNRYNQIPALSAAILTGNGVPPRDAGFRTKVPPVVFTSEDVYNREGKEAIKFQNWLNPQIHLLGTVGDFAQNFIINKPEILNEKTWDEIAIEVLSELYAAAKLDIPDWIKLTIERKGLEQTTDEVVLILRGYFMTLVNHECNVYRPPISMSEDDPRDWGINPHLSLVAKLIACCERRLIPFIHHDNHRKLGKVFYITIDIMRDLEKNKLGDMVSTLKGLADLLGFDYENVRIGDGGKQGKVIVVKEAQMKDFLEYKLSEISEEKDGDSDNTESEPEPSTTPSASKKKK